MDIVRISKQDVDKYQIEIAGPDSSEKLKLFWEKSFKEAYHDVHSSSDIAAYCTRNFTTKAALDVLSDQNCICSFAIHEEEIVGLSVILKKSCPIKPKLESTELKQLYLLSSEYGSGLGRLLMEDAIQKSKESGSQHLWLCVSNLNIRAFRFYQKIGFKKIGIGPILEVGLERLHSSIMIREI